MASLPPRSVLLTGATGKVGRRLALHLAAQGHRLALHFRSDERAADALKDAAMQAGAPLAITVQADLADEDATKRMAARVVEELGMLDVVINTSGTFIRKKFYDLSAEDWQAGLDSTVTASFFLSRAVLPALRASGRGRLILFGDSLCAHNGFAEPALSYYVGKAGVWMMAQTLAAQEASHGLTVNVVSPGMLEDSEGLLPVTQMPAGRYARHEDIHGAIDYLLSDAASYVTGTNLVVAGGWNVAPLFSTVLRQAGYQKPEATSE